MSEQRMTVETPFGTFDVKSQDVVTFPRGLPGFEQCRQFVLLSHATLAPLRCLHAVDGSRASFLAVDPQPAMADYRCSLPAEQCDLVGADAGTPLVWLALVALSDGEDVPTANLRAPVVINPTSMLAVRPRRRSVSGSSRAGRINGGRPMKDAAC